MTGKLWCRASLLGVWCAAAVGCSAQGAPASTSGSGTSTGSASSGATGSSSVTSTTGSSEGTSGSSSASGASTASSSSSGSSGAGPSTSGSTSSSTGGSTGTSSGGARAPLGDPGSWNLVFDDEFDGSALDSSRWSVGWFGSGITQPVNSAETACYDPANVSLANGELDLALVDGPESCGGTTEPYAGATLTSDGLFSFAYGFVEVRAWLAGSGATVYDWPQIWTDGQTWPDDGEIDLLEGLGGQACYHWHGPPNGTGYGDCPSGTFDGSWHTFGADWEPGSVTFYYDGANVGSVTSATSTITSSPMYLILGASTSAASGQAHTPLTERFDYVRVWQH